MTHIRHLEKSDVKLVVDLIHRLHAESNFSEVLFDKAHCAVNVEQLINHDGYYVQGAFDSNKNIFAVKEAVFPFNKFPNVDVLLGPEMKSTGEVMGIDKDFGLLPEIVSAVSCLVRSSNKIPVFLYLECFTFIINCNLSIYKYRLFSKT